MGECKAKAIQTNLGTFRHNQTYPGIIQAYSGIFRTLCYPDVFYNCGIFRTLTYSEPEAYSEPSSGLEIWRKRSFRYRVVSVVNERR